MPDAPNKDADSSPKKSNSNSPARRRHPHATPERASKTETDFKKTPHEPNKTLTKSDSLMTPGNFATYPVKPAQSCTKPSPIPSCETLSLLNPPSMSTSPPPSVRWAGPAFGNAPHPSSLPLPEWTSSPPPSPPVHDGGVYHHPAYHHTFFNKSSSSYSRDPSFSQVRVAPTPYVGTSTDVSSSPPSLAQLSTDLRRMLNINCSSVIHDPILVSANSS
jgi:hypothetical protein